MLSTVRDLLGRLLARLRPTRIAPVDPPLTFSDASDRTVTVRPYTDADREGLVAMYDDFDPTQRAQGTPPLGTEAVRHWLDGIVGEADVVAVHEGRVVGHVSFVADGTGRHELAIFVHQDYQGAGIGTRLMAAGMGHARRNGVGYVWLSVETWKRDVQRFYSRAGFHTVNAMGTAHRMSRTL